ncbi:MAG TPA: lytic transglycosylase domain-containing protein [Rhizomicrobium sp.]|nr:lytic transglycosylase domain-containing protein [Rhizomicrobium sp.]
MNPRQAGRGTHASDLFTRIGDYTILLCGMAFTLVVLANLPKVGIHGLERFVHSSPTLRRVLAYPIANIVMPSHPQQPAPAQSDVIYQQEAAMTPSQLLNRWSPLVSEASRRVGISEAWIKTVMRIESGGRTVQHGDQPLTSHAGAMGLMQLMRGTYNEMRGEYGLGADPANPHDNVIAGAAYLKWLYRKYGFPNMFAAYNAGPGKVDDHLQKGRPLPQETVHYLASATRILGVQDSVLGHGRHHRNLAAYASLVSHEEVPEGGRNHRHLRAYASLTPHRGHRVTATIGG